MACMKLLKKGLYRGQFKISVLQIRIRDKYLGLQNIYKNDLMNMIYY
jgi:hypothetical protein